MVINPTTFLRMLMQPKSLYLFQSVFPHSISFHHRTPLTGVLLVFIFNGIRTIQVLRVE